MAVMTKPAPKPDPAPEGLHLCVCCDVVDKPNTVTQWGVVDKIQIRWQTEAINPKTGKPYLLVQQFRNSNHAKASLRKMLRGWRGKDLTAAEVEKGYDIEAMLLGELCQIQVVHEPTDEGGVWVKLLAVLPATKGAKLKVRDYDRVQDRQGYVDPAANDHEADEALPF